MMYADGYMYGHVVGDCDNFNEALAAPDVPRWNTGLTKDDSNNGRSKSNVSNYVFENPYAPCYSNTHNFHELYSGIRENIRVPEYIQPCSYGTVPEPGVTRHLDCDISKDCLVKDSNIETCHNLYPGIGVNIPVPNFQPCGYRTVSECSITKPPACDNISKDLIISDPNIERNIEICNNYVENGEWLYNLARSIVEAEQEDIPAPSSNLSDSLNKILFTESNDPLTHHFNDKLAKNTLKASTDVQGFENIVKQNHSKLAETVNDNNEYINFMNYLKSSWRTRSRVHIKETEDDLFTLPTDYALAQCVSEDMWLSNEVAMHFRWRFERLEEIYGQKQNTGGLATLNVNGRFIYYLVTKRLSNDETVLQNLFNSLNKMFKHIKQQKIRKLAMSRIMSDVDGIKWAKVKPMLEYLCRHISIYIKVCNLQPFYNFIVPVQLTKCRVINVEYPLNDIEEGTIVIYFGLKDGFITDEIRKLNTRFRIIIDYRMANRNIGDVISAYKEDHKYLLCGLIVNETKDDQFDLANFQKCICALSKLNSKRQNKYSYVGIEAFCCDDELIMNKVVNILRYSFKNKVDIYVCWPEDLKTHMLLPVGKNRECI